EPLFTEKGELSDLTQKTFEMLKVYQQELSTTQAIFTQLAEKELVVDQEGFKAVDLEKITTLDDAAIAGFVKNGTMPLIYCHLQSLTHLHQTAS
ncbi:MAG: SapC family protein, partial [Proteobacteria bacterium]|nr:SapC family protein [Pseudomonadota bacterium]